MSAEILNQYPVQETMRMPEYSSAMEQAMEKDFESFGQIIFIKEHVLPDNRVVRKGVGISLAQIPGMTTKMREDILTQTLGIDIPEENHQQGLERGQIFWGSRDLDGDLDLSLIRKFIQVNGDVIDQEHPFRSHPKVDRYLGLQGSRYDFCATVIEDAENILQTPRFTGWSSMNPRYMGPGKPYIVEFYRDEFGVSFGSCPDGSMRRLDEIAIDVPHQFWMTEGLIRMLDEPMEVAGGWRIGGDGENTETADNCTVVGEETRISCADFYRLMESGGRIISSSDGYIKVIDTKGKIYVAEDPNFCKIHRKDKKLCYC